MDPTIQGMNAPFTLTSACQVQEQLETDTRYQAIVVPQEDSVLLVVKFQDQEREQRTFIASTEAELIDKRNTVESMAVAETIAANVASLRKVPADHLADTSFHGYIKRAELGEDVRAYQTGDDWYLWDTDTRIALPHGPWRWVLRSVASHPTGVIIAYMDIVTETRETAVLPLTYPDTIVSPACRVQWAYRQALAHIADCNKSGTSPKA